MAPSCGRVVLRRKLRTSLYGALLPLSGALLPRRNPFRLVVRISHDAELPLTATVWLPGAAAPTKLRVLPGVTIKVSVPCRTDSMAAAAKAIDSWTFHFEDGREVAVTSYQEIQTGNAAGACRQAAEARRLHRLLQRPAPAC